MSTEFNSSSYASPRPRRRSESTYCTPRSFSRRKNIRTVADVPISQRTHKHTKPRYSSRKKLKLKNTNSNKKKRSICCICLETMTSSDIASLDSCPHLYHRDCIISWSSIENACPLCKTRFMSITDVSNNNHIIPVLKKDQAPAYHIELGNIIWLDCVCTFCGADDNEHLLLLCDGCDDATHTYCMGLGDIIPEGDYYCEPCKHKYADYIHHNSDNNNDNHNHSDHSHAIASEIDNNNDSDEEYVPSPQRKRKRKRKKIIRRDRCVKSDEEYIPYNHNINNTCTMRVTRRSQRIRDIEMDNNDQKQNQNQARSASPLDRKRIKATSTLSALIGLPLSQNNGCKNVSRTQRMVVVDQNNNQHFLGFKKRNGDRQRFNSLANLFNNNRNNCNSDNGLDDHESDGYVSTMSTKSMSMLCDNYKCDSCVMDEKITTESEYTPSDFQSDLSDNYDMVRTSTRTFTMKRNRRNKRNCRKKKKCIKLRRSQRLRNQKLALLTDNEESDDDSDTEEEEEEDKECEDDEDKCKKSNRKRSFKEIEDVKELNMSHRKRVKYNDLRSRRYSCLSQL